VDDDQQLVRLCLAGDQAACAQLVERHSRMVGSVIWRATGDGTVVEDLAQETFLRAFRGLARFDGRAKLSTWLCTIAHRVAIDHLRKDADNRHLLSWPLGDANNPEHDRIIGNQAATEPSPEALVLQGEQEDIVRAGLARLPDKYRLPLVYAAIDGCDYETIATMLGMPLGTVKTLIFRGKRMLKDIVAPAMVAGEGQVRDAL